LAQPSRIPESLRNTTRSRIDKLKELRLDVKRNGNERKLAADIKSSLGNLEKYASSLAAYAKDFPEKGGRGEVFSKLMADEQKIWQSVEPWNQFVMKSGKLDFGKMSVKEFQAFADELKKMTEQHGAFPATDRLNQLLPYLVAAQGRGGNGANPIYTDFLTLLADKRIANVNMLIAENKRYYLSKKMLGYPRPDGLNKGNWAVWYDTDTSLGEAKDPTRTTIQQGSIENKLRADGNYDWTSPQTRFAQEAILKFDDLRKGANWETTFEALLVMLRNERTMEPTLLLHLMQKLLDIGCQGSYPLQVGFQPWQEILASNASPDIEANWIDPNDRDGQTARENAINMLRRLNKAEDFSVCLDRVHQQMALLAPQKRGPLYQWVGMQIKSDQNRDMIETFPSANEKSGALVVLVRKEPTGPISAEPVGNLVNGKAALNSDATASFREGRPVYLIEN